MRTNTMTSRTLLAGAALFGLAGAAAAQPATSGGPQLVNQNGSQEVVYDRAPGNVVGGAYASISGSGDNMTYQATPSGRARSGPALVATVENVNGTPEVIYTPQASTTALAALPGSGPARN